MAVESGHYTYIPIFVKIEEQTPQLQAFADTGLEGDLSVPPTLVPAGAAPFARQAWRCVNDAVVGALCKRASPGSTASTSYPHGSWRSVSRSSWVEAS